MSRRRGWSGALILGSALLAAATVVSQNPTTASASAPSCPIAAVAPALRGSFVDPNWETWWTAADTVNMAGQLCQAGITDVVLQQAADPDTHVINYPTTAAAFATFSYTGTDAIGNWVTALAAHPGMHLYLGLGLSSTSWFPAAGNLSGLSNYLTGKLPVDEALATDIVARYRARPGFSDVFAGWYLPDEVDAESFLVPNTTTIRPQASVVATLLLGPLTAMLHLLTPGKTVFTSPFYQADTFPAAAWSALWKTILNASVAVAGPSGAVDAIAPQDGLGHGGGSAIAPQLDAWFTALAAGISQSSAAGRTSVWDNVETYRSEGSLGHDATILDMLNAMRSASAHTLISKYLSFSYAEDQTPHAALTNGYLGYLRGTLDRTPPSVPGSLRVGATTNRAARTLTWTASSDPAGGSGLLAYRIFRDGQYAIQLDNPAQTSFADAHLTIGTHTWTVAAVDGTGNQSRGATPVTATVARSTLANLALHARYWFTAALPSAPYRDGCLATSAATACAGQLTGGHAGPISPLATQYPAMFAGYDGVLGTAGVVIDLGTARTVREIDSQWLTLTTMGVWRPATLTMSVSTDSHHWTTVSVERPPARPVNAGTWPYYVPVAQQGFSAVYTTAALHVTARYVQLVATNPWGSAGWTMTDAISVH